MNALPTMSITIRLNAVAAAAIVTLVMLSGIDTLANPQSSVPQLAQAFVAQPA